MYLYQEKAYLIKDPLTSSLIFIPSQQQDSSLASHISKIQEQSGCKISHTFFNLNKIKSNKQAHNIILPKQQGQLKPILIGQLSICFISAPGYTSDYHFLAVTHINSTSTKFPVLFTGGFLTACGIDIQIQNKSKQYLQSINKLRIFANQTYIFPQKKANIDDLQFSYAISKQPNISQRINLIKSKGQQFGDCLIPTSIMQQRMMNPFLTPNKFSSILKENDKNKCFQLLRQMRRKWKK